MILVFPLGLYGFFAQYTFTITFESCFISVSLGVKILILII